MKNTKAKMVFLIIVPILIFNLIYVSPIKTNKSVIAQEAVEEVNENIKQKQVSSENINDYETISHDETTEVNISINSNIACKNDTLHLNLLSDKKILDYYYIEEGLSVNTEHRKDDCITLEFLAIDQFGRLRIFIDLGQDTYIEKTCYTYILNDQVFARPYLRMTLGIRGIFMSIIQGNVLN